MIFILLGLLDRNIYFYKSKEDNKENYIKTNYLVGSFVKVNQPEIIQNEPYYNFIIILSNNETILRFFHKDLDVFNQWIKHIRLTIDYRNYFEHYKLLCTIAGGEYGKVTLAENIETKEKVATKILTKLTMNSVYWGLLKSEIDVLKLCKHKNIVRYIDNFENSEYIFIVMEFLPATLGSYLKMRNFSMPEKLVKQITYQITEALLYLQKFGIIHRDLKPDNIMIASNLNNLDNESIEIKINDFGFSKVLGQKERTQESYGTFAYLAPEIVIRLPYNKSIDVWSLGITMYYMISGELPFLGNSENELNKNICLKELEFTPIFMSYSHDMLKLISKCLVKDHEKRIKLEEIQNHSWFKGFDKN